ncbi:MAG TPA: VOC family protein, partial [Chloroflexota bacterium]|nr:VOC family protein [Chloroflexota bacterium]
MTFEGAYPIGDTDVQALPVRELGPAIGYYTQVLGFRVNQRTERTALLQRDAARIGLAMNGADPEQASCYFAVDDVVTLREELAGKGIEPSPIRPDEHGGRSLSIFFAKEPYGVCFCFGQPAI